MSTDYGVKYSTARDRILLVLKDLTWISWRMLRLYGGVRYGARIKELKRLGYKIEDEADPSGDGYIYRLLSPFPSEPDIKKVKIYIEQHDAEMLARGVATLATIAITRKALDIFRANKHKL